MDEEGAQGHAAGGVTLQEVEARLRREAELDRLDSKVIEALARAVTQLLQGVWAVV